MTDISAVSAAVEAQHQAQLKAIEVEKNLDVEIDIGGLTVVDGNIVEIDELKTRTEDYLKELCRGDVQLLFNKIYKLPIKIVDDSRLVELSKPTTVLPREKRIPKPHEATKWERYAKEKGIKRKERSKKVWDDKVNDWVPRYGYKRGLDQKEWAIEVPANADPYEDQFEKRAGAKAERKAKNEYQHLKNIARNTKSLSGILPTHIQSKDQVSRALTHSKRATASVGKFQPNLKTETKARNTGVKRKFEPNLGDMKAERSKQLDILSKLEAKKPKVSIDKAVNRHINAEQQKVHESKDDGGKKKGKKYVPSRQIKQGKFKPEKKTAKFAKSAPKPGKSSKKVVKGKAKKGGKK